MSLDPELFSREQDVTAGQAATPTVLSFLSWLLKYMKEGAVEVA